MDRLTSIDLAFGQLSLGQLGPGDSTGLSAYIATRASRELPLLAVPAHQCPWKGRWRPQFLAVLAAVHLLLQATHVSAW